MSNVAKQIQEQIGHRAFVMMGAKNLVAGESHLQFKIGANGKKVTHVTVTLTGADLYTVRFSNVRGLNVKTLQELDGVSVCELRNVISENTGLYLSL